MGEPKAGEVIGGRYVLESSLGKGGFGSVWRARDPGPPERSIALKILHVELARNPRMKERFTREAMVLGSLDHPCIARSLAFGTEAMPPFIAMELVKGRTLQSEIEDHAANKTQFSNRDILERMKLIAGAIDHAHKKSVIHRDLKPGNVIVDITARPLALKVLDFGVAKIVGQSGDATTAGRIIGSLHYLAPELIRGEELDPRADIFSLGTLLFELFTLRRQWTRDWEDRPLLAGKVSKEIEALNATPAVMQRILAGVRPRPGQFREGLPIEVDDVVLQAVAVDRKDRFTSAGEMVRALEAAFSGIAISAPHASLMQAVAPTAPLPTSAATNAPELPMPEIVVPTVATVMSPPPAVPDTVLVVHTPAVAFKAPSTFPRAVMRGLVALAIIAPIVAIALLLSVLREERTPDPLPVVEHAEPEVVAVPQPAVRSRAQEQVQEEEAPVVAQAEAPQIAKPKPRTQPEEKHPTRAPEPVPVPAPKYPELRALLKALEEKPNDMAIAEELSKKIIKAADSVSEADHRTSIKRCATAALFPLDPKELDRCYKELLAAH